MAKLKLKGPKIKGPKIKAPKGLGLPKGKLKDHLKPPKQKINKRTPYYFVNVCVYILPGANIGDNRIAEDFKRATNIWGFRFRTRIINLSSSTDSRFLVTRSDLACSSTIPDTTVERSLIRFGRGDCANNNPSHIIMFYTGADEIQGNIRACTKLRDGFNVTLLSNSFAPDTVAHELGHAFFNNNTSLNGNNPYKPLEGNTSHSSDNNNIMAPGSTRNSNATANRTQIIAAIAANNPRLVFLQT